MTGTSKWLAHNTVANERRTRSTLRAQQGGRARQRRAGWPRSRSLPLEMTTAHAAATAPPPALAAPPSAPVVARSLPVAGGARPITLAAAEPLVVATPFLGWAPAAAVSGVAQVQLSEWQMLTAFAAKARGAPDAASQTSLANRNALTLQLNTAWWSTYLTELVAGGLLRATLASREELQLVIKDVTPVNPAALLVSAGDWAACEDFAAPGAPAVPGVPGAAAVRARGTRAAIPAVPAVPPVPAGPPVPGPAELAFLNLASVALLEDHGGPCPWAAVARVCGMLGAAVTRAIRLEAMSNVRRTAALLRAAVARNLGLAATAEYDAPIAGELGNFLRAAFVPDGLEAHGVSTAELSSEAADAFRAQRSKADLMAIEEKRFHLLNHRSPLLHSLVISNSASNSEAYGATRRLAALVDGDASEPLCPQLPSLEEGLRVRLAEARDAAAKPGANGGSVIRALEAEARCLGVSRGAGDKRELGADAVPQDALEKAGRSPVFRQVLQVVQGGSLTTAARRIAALGSAFDGKSPLTARMLMDGSETMAKRHPLLQTLFGLRPFVSEYLEYALTVDVGTGLVPPHLARFTLALADGSPCPLVTGLLKFGVHEINWLDPPFGMLGLKARREQQLISAVNPLDHYCQPELLDDLGPFMHTVMVAFGAPAASTVGFTMAAWVARYTRHIRCASGLGSVAERVAWIKQADEWFRASLQLIQQLWKAAIHTTTPADTQWLCVLPFDNSMAKGMDAAEIALDELKAKRHQFAWMTPAAAGPSNPYRLPLLSAHQPKPERPDPSGGGRGQPGGRGTPSGRGLARGGGEQVEEPKVTAPEPRAAAAHGSLAYTWMYLPAPRQTDLLMGRTVWDTAAEAKHYKVAQKAKCWPVINSGRAEAKLMAQCDKTDRTGHRTLKDACHVLPGFEREFAFQSFTRPATEEELKLLEAQQPEHVTGRRRPAPGGGTPRSSRRPRREGAPPLVADPGTEAARAAAAAGRMGDRRAPDAGKTGLPRVAVGTQELTPEDDLGRALGCLARRLAPHRGIRDCGGGGDCGPLTLAYLMQQLDLTGDDASTVRARAVAHVRAHASTRVFAEASLSSPAVTLEDIVLASLRAWPTEVLQDLEAESLEEWCRVVSQAGEYTDAGFLCAVADCYSVHIALEAVDISGAPVPEACLKLSPCDGRAPLACLEVAAVVQHHFAAIVDVRQGWARQLPRGGHLAAAEPEMRPAPLPKGMAAFVRLCRSHVESWRSLTPSERTIVEERIVEISALEAVGACSETEALAVGLAMADDHALTSTSLLLGQGLSAEAGEEQALQDDMSLAAGLSLSEEDARGSAVAEEAAAFQGDVDLAIGLSLSEAGARGGSRAEEAAAFERAVAASIASAASDFVGDGSELSDESDGDPMETVAEPEPAEAAELVPARRPAGARSVSWAAELVSTVAPLLVEAEPAEEISGAQVLSSAGASPPATLPPPTPVDATMPAPPPPPVPADELAAAMARRGTSGELPTDEVTLSHAGSRGVVSANGTMADEQARSHALDDGPTGGEWCFPLTTVSQVLALLADPKHAPTDLVACEFSGALRQALERAGRRAISADWRDCEVGGMHFRGDVRLLLTITAWERAYLFPPCSMTLRGDEDCLALKISDGRAFWGAAFVVFCWTVVTALVVVVEQPDTIVADFYPLPPGEGHYFEFRTTEYGDREDKFVRLAVRNALIKPGSFPKRRQPQPHRSQFLYSSVDERDRQRSTWRPYPAVCQALATLAPCEVAIHFAPAYEQAIRCFSRRWHEAGYPVPVEFAAPDCQPVAPAAREYSLLRGPGDGRVMETAPPTAFADRATGRGDAGVIPGGRCFCCDGAGGIEDEECLYCEGSGRDVDWGASLGRLGGTVVTADPATPVSLVDVRDATAAAVLLVYVCVLGQPLVYAHMDGFTMHGVELPEEVARSSCMPMVQRWVEAVTVTTHYAFLVGEYIAGARLFTAPLELAPDPRKVVRTAAQRRRLSLAGVAFAWCTLAALSGLPASDAAWRAVTAVNTFVKPVSQLADAPAADGHAIFRFGATPTRSLLRQPLLENEASPPLWAALARLEKADKALLAGLAAEAGDPLLDGWAERVTPFDATSIPSSLMDALPDFEDTALDTVLLSAVRPPIETPWMPVPPLQSPPPLDTPSCPRSPIALLLPEAQEAVRRWLLATLEDLVSVRDALASGVSPDEVARERPRPLAVGQTELHAWARGRVWDCRQECCRVADFGERIDTHLNLTFLHDRLLHYPDQTLLANLLDGVRLDADVELQTVLVPHLTSLSKGYASVEKELRRLHGLGWYDLFDDFPFWPMYLNGQGSTARKLEPDRFRRTTEGGGPRRPTFDLSGLAAISINAASRVHHLPQYFLQDDRPVFREWLSDRGLSTEGMCEMPPGKSKWPREVKPQVCQLLRDLAVLRRASEILGEPLYVFGDDAKDYFNQLAMHPSELWKLGIVFLAGEGDLAAETSDMWRLGTADARLVFVSEKRLGFGTHGASNIAQRFSDALLAMFREDMDDEEAEANAADTRPSMERWRRVRQQAQESSGEPCVPNRQWAASETRAPTEVCPQARLYAAYMFTDDPLWVVVGVSRTLRALRVWRRLTNELGLIMAIPEKRTLGTWAGWIGVVTITVLGLVVVPRDKLVRAVKAVEHVLTDVSEFGSYRSLIGLLEHIRQANLLGKHYMHGLYAPHGADGASQHGPSGVVVCDVLMRKQLQRWRTVLFRASGVSAKRALNREELEAAPSIDVEISSDARRDLPLAGMGGFMHGSFWFWRVEAADAEFLLIPELEFMALCVNIVTFGDVLLAAAAAGSRIVVRTDALTAALTLPEESQRSPLLVAAYQWLLAQVIFQKLRPHIAIAHLYGDANPFSDYVSRALWRELQRLCVQVGLKPQRIDVHPACAELYREMLMLAQRGTRKRALGRLGRCGGRGGTGFRARMLEGSQPASPPTAASVTTAASGGAAPPSPLQPSAGFLARMAGRAGHAAAATASSGGEPAGALTPYTLPSAATAPRGGLPMPTMPEASRLSSLSVASRHFAQVRAAALSAAGQDPAMQLSAQVAGMMQLGAAVQETVDFGINANTLRKDERAWEFWEAVCEQQGTSPLRTASEARDFPERNAHLLAVLMLYAFAVCRPHRGDRAFIKPRSALAYPLAIIRVFGRWGIPMPSYKMLKASLCGLLRLYLAYHGPYSLSPRRAEPMKFSMVRAMDSIPSGTKVGELTWTDSDHDVFMFRRVSVVLIFTGFRLAELVEHTSGEIMYLTFESLSWLIGGVVVTDPSPSMLARLRPGLDGALLAPPRAKPDQWGEIHCPFPAMLIYRTDDVNAAAALRDVELRSHCRGAARQTTPLFHDRAGRPYTHGVLDRLLKMVLLYCFGAAVAAVFTWHSYRAGLATALHAAGVPDPIIQLTCRWMCPESLHAYRRVGTREHDANLRLAATADVTTIQAANVARVAADEGFAEILHASEGASSREAERAFEEAKQEALRETTPKPRPNVEAAAVAAPPPAATAAAGSPPRRVLVPAAVYPDERCDERGGVGWEAVVLSSTAATVKIEFVFARDTAGEKFEHVRLPWRCVTPLE